MEDSDSILDYATLACCILPSDGSWSSTKAIVDRAHRWFKLPPRGEGHPQIDQKIPWNEELVRIINNGVDADTFARKQEPSRTSEYRCTAPVYALERIGQHEKAIRQMVWEPELYGQLVDRLKPLVPPEYTLPSVNRKFKQESVDPENPESSTAANSNMNNVATAIVAASALPDQEPKVEFDLIAKLLIICSTNRRMYKKDISTELSKILPYFERHSSKLVKNLDSEGLSETTKHWFYTPAVPKRRCVKIEVQDPEAVLERGRQWLEQNKGTLDQSGLASPEIFTQLLEQTYIPIESDFATIGTEAERFVASAPRAGKGGKRSTIPMMFLRSEASKTGQEPSAEVVAVKQITGAPVEQSEVATELRRHGMSSSRDQRRRSTSQRRLHSRSHSRDKSGREEADKKRRHDSETEENEPFKKRHRCSRRRGRSPSSDRHHRRSCSHRGSRSRSHSRCRLSGDYRNRENNQLYMQAGTMLQCLQMCMMRIAQQASQAPRPALKPNNIIPKISLDDSDIEILEEPLVRKKKDLKKLKRCSKALSSNICSPDASFAPKGKLEPAQVSTVVAAPETSCEPLPATVENNTVTISDQATQPIAGHQDPTPENASLSASKTTDIN